jgi:hypothetical protein
MGDGRNAPALGDGSAALAAELVPRRPATGPLSARRLRRPLDLVLMRPALEEARKSIPELTEEQRKWLSLAESTLGFAERVAAAAPEGVAGTLSGAELYRLALHAALLAHHPDRAPTPIQDAWDASIDVLAHIEPDPAARDRTGRALCREGSLAGATDLVELATLRRFARGLVGDLSAPVARYRALLARRAASVIVAVAIGIALVTGIVTAATTKPNLLRHAASRTSSLYSPFDAKNTELHTNLDDRPWIEFDPGAATSISSLTIENRRDCCEDRAVPLVVEVSLDGVRFEEVARRSHAFRVWAPRFSPVTARFLRLSVPRKTFLHLRRVMAHR